MATEDTTAEGLARDFLNAIGEQALTETGGDRWASGAPLNPPQVETSAGSGPPPEKEPAAEPVAPETEQKPEWFAALGYKSPEEAIKGFNETRRWAKEGWDQVNALKAVTPQPQAAPPPDPLAELENFGVPQKPLKEAIQSLAVQAVQQMFAPAVQRMNADAEIKSRYPEYESNFEKLTQFVESDAELKEKVIRAENAGEFLLARELAWLNYERAGALQKSQDLVDRNQQRVAQAESVKADAAVTKPSAADARTNDVWDSPNNIPDEKFTDLMALAKAGYPQQLWKNTIGRVLEKQYPSVFGPEGNI